MNDKKSAILKAQEVVRDVNQAALALPFEQRGELAHASKFILEQAEALRFERERVAALQERYFTVAGTQASFEFDRQNALALAHEIIERMLDIPDRTSPPEDPQALVASAEEITDCVLMALEARFEKCTGRSVLGGRSQQRVCDARADTGCCEHVGQAGYSDQRCPPYA